jgi:uncharacterized protein (TIGR02611 family)
MFTQLKKTWHHFRDAEPGKRFLLHYRRHQAGSRSKAAAVGYMVLGVALVAVGVLGLIVPGPGLLGIALGFAVLAQESEKASKLLDRLELWIRHQVARFKKWWKQASLLSKILVTAVGCIVGFAAAAAVGFFFIRKFLE